MQLHSLEVMLFRNLENTKKGNEHRLREVSFLGWRARWGGVQASTLTGLVLPLPLTARLQI